jgi:hypothetical protein
VHADVYPRFQRHYPIRAWGIRTPLAIYCDTHGIDYLFFWDKKRNRTYCVEMDTVRTYGFAGEHDQFGGTINVPEVVWEVLPGKLPGVPFISGLIRTYLDPAITPPWDLAPQPPVSVPVSVSPPSTPPVAVETIPATTQLAFDWSEGGDAERGNG